MSVPVNERLLLTLLDAAAYLSIGQTLFKEYVAAGDIRPLRVGIRGVRFRRSDCEALADRIEKGETTLQRKASV
ncbi:hypothetical protein [Roseiconus lacunae]|uniref:DNA-binding protein n=1 Tax=Roseiconus lacunae TaxID=2605694 RepID=A0ABT7PEZ2_9BACT|nr:hypothetical protein [Roseiconus lacunae]MCD0460026.1 hypothetical protein [Roseiconus lacunae]MDM4014933.1 hypothetical protein [Roseiconus lacunae]